MTKHSLNLRTLSVGVGLAAATALFTMAGGAQAATTLAGPVDLGTATSYGVLGASTVTNTGPTAVNGDVGVSPGTAITGFSGLPNGSYTGALHQTDAAAAQAQSDLTTAFNAAAGLTPTISGLSELDGLSLTPGVYSGGALELANNGTLTLAGSANSVWVFQTASTLTIGSGTKVVITGGASGCNVFWKVGSSATLGTDAQFQGTVLAAQSITATTGATVVGRLLASTAAVTLDSNAITVPTGCPLAESPTTVPSPEITSATPPSATQGVPYDFTVTASGTPAPVFTITGGSLPTGLTLNEVTGQISGVPSATGAFEVTITAANGVGSGVSAIYTIQTLAASTPTTTTAAPTVPGGGTAVGSAQLSATGSSVALPLVGGGVLALAGVLTVAFAGRRRGFGTSSKVG